jgi:hypothetical protein
VIIQSIGADSEQQGEIRSRGGGGGAFQITAKEYDQIQ